MERLWHVVRIIHQNMEEDWYLACPWLQVVCIQIYILVCTLSTNKWLNVCVYIYYIYIHNTCPPLLARVNIGRSTLERYTATLSSCGKWNNIPRLPRCQMQPCPTKCHFPLDFIHIESISAKRWKTTAIPTPNSRVDKTCRRFLAQVVASLWDPTQRTQHVGNGFDVESTPFFCVFFQASSPDLCLNLAGLTQLNMILSILNANVVVFWQVFGAASSHSRDLHSSYSCYDVLNPFRFWGANLGYHLHSSPIWKTQ